MTAMRTVGAWFGGFAGFGGVEHGYFELLQGNVAATGLIFPSMGPPCVAADTWHGCEPAMSLVPNLLATGIVSLLLGVVTFVWAVGFLRRRHAGFVLALLCVALLLTGGGIVPAVIGIVGGVLCMWTPGPALQMVPLRRGIAALWPWSLVVLGVFLVGMVVVGYFSNDMVLRYGLVILVAIPALALLSGLSAWAHDGIARPAGFRKGSSTAAGCGPSEATPPVPLQGSAPCAQRARRAGWRVPSRPQRPRTANARPIRHRRCRLQAAGRRR